MRILTRDEPTNESTTLALATEDASSAIGYARGKVGVSAALGMLVRLAILDAAVLSRQGI